MPFEFHPMPGLEEVVLVKARIFPDDRGFFLETFKASDFRRAGLPGEFAQDNHSSSRGPGVLRGLHYQKAEKAQGKLVRCTEGEVLDVAVDIRRGSPTFGRWVAATLRAAEGTMLYVPEGFAHAFCTLTPQADVSYRCTREYSPAHERSIRWDDPQLAIAWPTRTPILAKKDAEAPLLKDADIDFVWGKSS